MVNQTVRTVIVTGKFYLSQKVQDGIGCMIGTYQGKSECKKGIQRDPTINEIVS